MEDSESGAKHHSSCNAAGLDPSGPTFISYPATTHGN